MKFIVVINSVCVCVRTSGEDGNFQGEGGGCLYLTIYLIGVPFALVFEI